MPSADAVARVQKEVEIDALFPVMMHVVILGDLADDVRLQEQGNAFIYSLIYSFMHSFVYSQGCGEQVHECW